MSDIVRNDMIFKALEEWAPQHLAYDWDNVGLQVGSFKNVVKKVMITLDVLESVVDEAITNDVNLIIAHHPLMFKPLKKIDVDSAKGRIIEKLIKHDITVYASHTNLDVAERGVNDLLADQIGIINTENLVDLAAEKLLKLVVYVPVTHADEVRNVLGEADAGYIGNYSHCTFNSQGKGTFKPLEGTSPYLGKTNEIEYVDEIKIETIVRASDLSAIVKSVIIAHPYEEVAYDVFTLENKGKQEGIGRVGLLEKRISLRELANHVKETFKMTHVRVTGELGGMIEKVAILGGSGENFIEEAIHSEADVYITGDMTFHHAQDAMEMGLSVIDAGHYIEKVMKDAVKEYLEKKFSEEKLIVFVSKEMTDPFQFI